MKLNPFLKIYFINLQLYKKMFQPLIVCRCLTYFGHKLYRFYLFKNDLNDNVYIDVQERYTYFLSPSIFDTHRFQVSKVVNLSNQL